MSQVPANARLLLIARKAEESLASRAAAGTASTTDALRAKAKRIEAEVALLRARQE